MGRMDDLLRKSGRDLGHQPPSAEDGPQRPPRPRAEDQLPIEPPVDMLPPGTPKARPEVQADAIYTPEGLEEAPAAPQEYAPDAGAGPPPADFRAQAFDDSDDDPDDDEITIIDTPPQREPLSDEDKQRLVSLFAPSSPQGKRIDMLRSQLLYPFHGDPPRTIMVSSAAHREGRTLLTTNLAISFARGLQQFVMIIDCHLANPEIHRLLQVPLRPGLTDYLEHGFTVPEIIHWTSVDKLS